MTQVSPLGKLAFPETGSTPPGCDSGPYPTLSPAMPRICVCGVGLSAVDSSLGSLSLPALRSQAVTRRFGPSSSQPSSSGCFSQPPTPVEADGEGRPPCRAQQPSDPAGVSATQDRGRTRHTGSPEPPSASLAARPCSTEAGSKLPASSKVSACLPYLWPAQSLLFTGSWFSFVSLTFVRFSRPSASASARLLFFPAFPSGQQRAPPKRLRDQGGSGSASPDPGTV